MHIQNEEDFKNQLKDQIKLLEVTTEAYDRGDVTIAKLIAVTIRVLVHDTGSSKSLLAHLGKKNIEFYDTSNVYVPGNLLPEPSLVILEIRHDGARFVAPLDEGPPSRYVKGKVLFDDWWTNDIIIDDKKGNALNRKSIVLDVANKDGGAHVDAKLNEEYVNLFQKNSLGITYQSADGKEGEIEDAVYANVRQIAHEMLKSLKDEFPEYF